MATLGQQAVGTTVKIQLGGALKDFIIVHQGYPSSLYDSSCNGTWVLQKEIPKKYKWYNDTNDHYNTYPGSYMDTYANNEYFNSIEADIRNRIKQVKIPYTLYGYRDPSTGANGHPVKVFPLSAWEIGATGDFRSPVDGSRLAYFDATNEASSKRVATYNGSAIVWSTRSPCTNDHDDIVEVKADGSLYAYGSKTNPQLGYRFAFILPSDLYLDSGGHVITNTPPVISGSDGALGTFGDTPPSYQYTVTDAQGGAVSVSERVDSTTLRTYQPSLGAQNTASIPVNTWKSLANGSHSLVITATDPAGASVTRTMTFTKNATAPAITGTDTSLGSFAETAPSYQYTVTDAQGGTVTVTETLDGAVRRTYAVTLGQANTLTFPAEEWRTILNGTHTIRVQAVDPLGLTTVRTVTFTKNVTSLAFEQTAAMNADAMPDRCIVNIQGEFPAGSTLKVEICNNGNDASPTWEDITQNVLNGQRYFFTNQTKTAASWGVRLRASLSRGTASGPCYIASLGGNFQ